MSPGRPVSNLLAWAGEQLGAMEQPRLEAEVLLGHVLDRNRAWLFAHSKDEVNEEHEAVFRDLVERRVLGHPIAYLTGQREFWSLPLQVGPEVLIPRPETELLVEIALDHLSEDSNAAVIDLGTGSGAIALAVASERPLCHVDATDISEMALRQASSNAERLGIGNVCFHHASWFGSLPGPWQLVLSNPPYVEEHDPHLQLGDCRFEPQLALTPGADGLAAIREICELLGQGRLVKGGLLAVEHGYEQGEDCRQLFAESGLMRVETRRDLAGLERVTLGYRA